MLSILSLKPAKGSNNAVFTNKNRFLLTQLGQIQTEGNITLEGAIDSALLLKQSNLA